MSEETSAETLDVLIVGAGFGGLYMLHKLRAEGFNVQVVEAAPKIGGTWYHNRYPGCRCDVESMQYSYTFSEELRNGWDWSERYAAQPEILAYANYVADTLDLRRDIVLNTRVTSAQWQADQSRWCVTAQSGQQWTPRFVVMATGCLSVPRMPNIPGVEQFQGTLVHTANWPESGLDLGQMHVGLIGTGSSGVQAATTLASSVKNLSVFQRSPAYSIPARNRPLTVPERAAFRENFAELDAWARTTGGGIMAGPATRSVLEVSDREREDILLAAWESGGAFPFGATFNDIRTNEEANKLVAEFVRSRIRHTVKNPDTAELLCAHDLIATRRLCVDTGYYEIFNRPNVDLIDTKADAIQTITPGGIRLASGAEHALDALVLATGYDAMTGAILAIDIKGIEGQSLREAWRDGPKTFLGLTIAGFPNLFTVTGPGSPSVLSNMIRSIEHHVEWISGCLTHLRDQGQTAIMAQDKAQEEWVAHVNAIADKTLYPKAASWYMGADIPGKPRVFMPFAGGLPSYVKSCTEVAENGYRGFSRMAHSPTA